MTAPLLSVQGLCLHTPGGRPLRPCRSRTCPLAHAAAPLRDLSPGERLRAALICALAEACAPELLVLDEPTDHLDFVGLAALESVLRTWPGGLVVVGHDDAFLEAIGIEQRVVLCAPNDC